MEYLCMICCKPMLDGQELVMYRGKAAPVEKAQYHKRCRDVSRGESEHLFPPAPQIIRSKRRKATNELF